MMKTTTTPIYKSTKDGKVRITMTLDPRKGTEREMPVCVRVRIVNLQRYFLMPNERYTSEEFASIINEDNRKQGRRRKIFDYFFDTIHRAIKDLLGKGELEPSEFLELLTNRINGIKKAENTNTKDRDGKERFEPQYRQRLFEPLGMFLFSYMANGANMADLALLRYDDFYYHQDLKAMRFTRKKP